MSQVQFAETMKVAQSTISKIEKGTCLPEFSFLTKLHEIYKIDINQIIKSDGLDRVYEMQKRVRKKVNDKKE